MIPEFSDYFSGKAENYLKRVLQLALDEDGIDLTSHAIFTPMDRVKAYIVAKSEAVVSGLPVIPWVMNLCADHAPKNAQEYSWEALAKEGELVPCGKIVARLNGSTRQILKAERIILDFLCHLSGIATMTRTYVQALEGTKIRLLDTRKTLPGLRYPDKYAVLCGGGLNHRRNLEEMIMIKDNHIDSAGSISQAVAAVRRHCQPCPPIEVECRNADEVREAVACHVDRLMFDNMTNAEIAEALPLVPESIETEMSGGVGLEKLRTLRFPCTRQLDFVSVGKITHSAPSADFSLRIEKI